MILVHYSVQAGADSAPLAIACGISECVRSIEVWSGRVRDPDRGIGEGSALATLPLALRYSRAKTAVVPDVSVCVTGFGLGVSQPCTSPQVSV